MHHYTTLSAALTALLAALPSAQAMYTKSSPVLQLNSRNFDSLITKSNHTSVSNDSLTAFMWRCAMS